MLTALAPDEQISTAHRAKRAYIYVRQSSVNQMKHHRESTELQYRLVDRAVDSAGRVSGSKSSTKTSANPGPAAATAAASRSSSPRSASATAASWSASMPHGSTATTATGNQLLELCSLFGVLIADGERSSIHVCTCYPFCR